MEKRGRTCGFKNSTGLGAHGVELLLEEGVDMHIADHVEEGADVVHLVVNAADDLPIAALTEREPTQHVARVVHVASLLRLVAKSSAWILTADEDVLLEHLLVVEPAALVVTVLL